MSTHVLNIDKHQKPKDIFDFLVKSQPKRGDHLKLVSKELLDSRFIILLAAIIPIIIETINKKKKLGDSEKFLKDLFTDFSSIKDYENFIKNEYGVTFTVEQPSTEIDDWYNLAAKNFEGAYSDDEPDISEIVLKEPNPKYVKNK